MSTLSSKNQSALDVDRILEEYDRKHGPAPKDPSPKRFSVKSKDINVGIKNFVKIDKSGHIKFKQCC